VTLALRSRLTLVYTAAFGVLLFAIVVIAYRTLAHQLDADATARLTELTEGLHGYLRFEGGTPALVFDQNDADQAAFVHEAGRYFQIYDADTGELLVQSDALGPLGVRFTPAEVRGFRDGSGIHEELTDSGRLRLLSSVIQPAGRRRYLLQVGVSMRSIDSLLTRSLKILLWSAVGGLFAAAFVGRWMTGLGLAPLTSLATAARTVTVLNLQQRLPIRGTADELDAVAHAFNDTLARLEATVGEMRQFSAALAHELRTPLTALRGGIEMAMREPRSAGGIERRLASELEEIDKLKRLIDQVLTLARADAGEIPLALHPVDLGALAASLVEQLEPVAQARAIDLRCERGEAVMVEGDAEWLKRLVLNLVDNAIKFTPEGGRIVVGVACEAGLGTLTVGDTGHGIAPAMKPHIFERFFRADPARSPSTAGAGLGLSLVKWIIDRHSGRIDVDSHPGRGSTFTVRLPLASASTFPEQLTRHAG
jgi:two-component system, OmpR family, sensor kinase